MEEAKTCPICAGAPCRKEECMWYSTRDKKCAVLLCAEYLATFCDFVWDEIMRS